MTTERSSTTPLTWFGIGLAFIAFVYLIVALSDRSGEELEKAEMSYQQGEIATTLAERKDAFNNALDTYLRLDARHQPYFGNGKLYYNLGNTYYQLEEYPLAIWSYSKALTLMPRHKNLEENLQQARQLAGVSETSLPSFFEQFFDYFSLPERLQLILLFLSLSFLLFSGSIWLNKTWMKYLGSFFFILLLTFLASVFYTQFIDPTEAIILQGTSLYRDAGAHYAKVKEEPLMPGSKVKVLQVVRGGRWIKIMTSDGILGYVPYENLRVI